MSDESKPSEMESLFAELELARNQVALEDAESFVGDALRFTTWYLAVRDRRDQPPLDYLKAQSSVTEVLGDLISFPTQHLFSLTCDIAESFLNGFVNPEEFQKLTLESEKVATSLGKAVAAIYKSGKYSIGDDAMGMPKIVTDAFYPISLVEMIKKYVNEEGLVVNLSPLQRKLLQAFFVDEITGLKRIKKPNLDLG